MKKITTTILAMLILTMALNAQKIRIGFDGGLLLGYAKTITDGKSSSSKGRIGFKAGIKSDVQLSDNFSFQPSLYYLQKGGEDSENDGTNVTKYSIGTNYLELPLNVVYHTKGKNGSFIIGAGPSFSYALSGNIKVTTGDVTVSEKINFGKDGNIDLKRPEIGGNFLLGYELSNSLSFTLNYNAAFTNISEQPGSSWKNSYFGLSVGYFLKRNNK